MMEHHALARQIFNLCTKIREQRPLVHVITNFVVMNQTANALLALGASPTMSWAKEDAEHMSNISDALCINMGTPLKDRIEVMKTLMGHAQEMNKPVVLDPVGSGAGAHRTGIAKSLFSLAPHKIIRGNASEVCSLVDDNHTTRGVDNTISLKTAKKILMGHGRTQGSENKLNEDQPGWQALLTSASALIISGENDMILGTDQRMILKNGTPLMNAVTGTGCILSAMTAAFYAVAENGFDAAVAAAAVAAIAGELAAEKAAGPGTFMPHFMDALYHMDQETLTKRLNAEN
ncbi:hydroxyethylthiazole kinase [Desulfocicer niacini]